MFKKVLVALDGSALAETALPYVTDIAGRFRSRVHIVNVISEADRAQGLDRIYDTYLARIATDLKTRKVQCLTALLSGNPSEQIPPYATANGIELIVLTTLGKSGAGRWHVGSVAEKLATTSNIPLLVIPVYAGAKKTTGPFFRNVLVPVDVSTLGEAALPCVEAIAAMAERSRAGRCGCSGSRR